MESTRLYGQLFESKIKSGKSFDKWNSNHNNNNPNAGNTSNEITNIQNFISHRWK